MKHACSCGEGPESPSNYAGSRKAGNTSQLRRDRHSHFVRLLCILIATLAILRGLAAALSRNSSTVVDVSKRSKMTTKLHTGASMPLIGLGRYHCVHRRCDQQMDG